MPARILVVDDEADVEPLLSQGFRRRIRAGELVLAFESDGEAALKRLTGDPAFDVVLTDINMPRMDGYEVIRQMRKNAVHKSTPILVLTTESEAAKRNIAREAGATGWMVKPFDPDRLVATINKVAP